MILGRRRSRRFADVVRSSVVLHLQGGDSIAGVLLAEYEDVYALSRARTFSEAGGRMIELDGELLIPKERVVFAQIGVKIDDVRALELAAVTGSRGVA